MLELQISSFSAAVCFDLQPPLAEIQLVVSLELTCQSSLESVEPCGGHMFSCTGMTEEHWLHQSDTSRRLDEDGINLIWMWGSLNSLLHTTTFALSFSFPICSIYTSKLSFVRFFSLLIFQHFAIWIWSHFLIFTWAVFSVYLFLLWSLATPASYLDCQRALHHKHPVRLFKFILSCGFLHRI